MSARAEHTVELALRADIVSDVSGLEALQKEWTALFEHVQCGNPFLSHAWMLQWWLHFGAGHRLFVVVVRNTRGQLRGIAPLYVRRARFSQRQLHFIADRYVGSDHLDLLVAPDTDVSAIAEIASAIVRYQATWNSVELTSCDAESKTLVALRDAMRENGKRVLVERTGVCPVVHLPPSFQTYLDTLSSLWRRNFRYSLRQLARAGAVKLEIAETPRDALIRYEAIVHLHRLRFADQKRKSAILSGDIQAFHRAALSQMAECGMARLYVLAVDGQPVAGCYGLTSHGCFRALQMGLDPSWMRQSAGLAIMGLAIEDCIGRGCHTFDFLRGDERYKFHWTGATTQTIIIRLFDNSVPGLLRLAACRLAVTWRRLRGVARRRMDGSVTARKLLQNLGILPL